MRLPGCCWAGAFKGFLFFFSFALCQPHSRSLLLHVSAGTPHSQHFPCTALGGGYPVTGWVPHGRVYILAKWAPHGGCMAQNKVGAPWLGRCPQP